MVILGRTSLVLSGIQQRQVLGLTTTMKATTRNRLFHCLSSGLTRTNTNTNSATNNIVASSRSRLSDSHTNDVSQRIVPTRHFASVSALSLTSKKRKGQKISVVTAYDFPSAVHVARAGIDVLLVGDSAAMVELGFDTTQPMTLDEMLHHCRSVKRGLDIVTEHKPLLVGDMPFGTYEFEDTDVALRNAYRFVKEAGVDAVKLEGGSKARANTVQKIVEGGVAVMGHIGLTPQAISVLGGFRAQGRTANRARQLVDEGLRLQDAGAFSIVLECVPGNVAAAVTESLEIPTIGIGAGGGTSGQVLVFHDMLGMLSHPHHEQFVPKFCKKYAQVGHIIQDGLQTFRDDVEKGIFPGKEFSPYIMSDTEKKSFDALLETDREERKRKLEETSKKLTQADEYEQLHLYGKK